MVDFRQKSQWEIILQKKFLSSLFVPNGVLMVEIFRRPDSIELYQHLSRGVHYTSTIYTERKRSIPGDEIAVLISHELKVWKRFPASPHLQTWLSILFIWEGPRFDFESQRCEARRLCQFGAACIRDTIFFPVFLVCKSNTTNKDFSLEESMLAEHTKKGFQGFLLKLQKLGTVTMGVWTTDSFIL